MESSNADHKKSKKQQSFQPAQTNNFYKTSFRSLRNIYLLLKDEKGAAESTQNDSLWNTIKKTVNGVKMMIRLADSIDRTHHDYHKMKHIEKEITKLEYLKQNEIYSVLSNSGLTLASETFVPLEHSKSSLITLFQLNDQLENIAKNHTNSVNPEIGALANRALQLKRRLNTELGSIDNQARLNAKKYSLLASMEKIDLDGNIVKDLLGVALLYSMSRELNKMIKEVNNESLIDEELLERLIYLKMNICEKIKNSDRSLKKQLFFMVDELFKKNHLGISLIEEIIYLFNKKINKMKLKRNNLNSRFKSKKNVTSSDVKSYIDSLNDDIMQLYQYLNKINRIGNELMCIISDNDLTLSDMFDDDEIKCISEVVSFSKEIESSVKVFERSFYSNIKSIYSCTDELSINEKGGGSKIHFNNLFIKGCVECQSDKERIDLAVACYEYFPKLTMLQSASSISFAIYSRINDRLKSGRGN